MKRSQRFRIAEQLEARCVLSAAAPFDFGDTNAIAAFSSRESNFVGPALVSSARVSQSIVATATVVQARDVALSQAFLDCRGACNASLPTALAASAVRSGIPFSRSNVLGPFSSQLDATFAPRSLPPLTASTQIASSTAFAMAIGPTIPKGFVRFTISVFEHFVEPRRSPETIPHSVSNVQPQSVPQQIQIVLVSNPSRVRQPRLSSPNSGPPQGTQGSWAAAYLLASNENAQEKDWTDSPGDGNEAEKVTLVSHDSGGSPTEASNSSSTRTYDEGGFVEFALLSTGEKSSANGESEGKSLDVLAEVETLLPWEIDEALIDEVLAADVGAGDEVSEQPENASGEETAQMLFSVTEGGLVSLDGSDFPAVDAAVYSIPPDENAANVAASGPIEIRMEAVLRLFQAFEVTTDVLDAEPEAATEYISVPIETLPVEATPVENVAPTPKDGGPSNASQAAAVVVGMVAVGTALGRRSRSGDDGDSKQSGTERAS